MNTRRMIFAALLCTTISAASLPVAATTMGYWRFEEGVADGVVAGSGTVLDSSGAGTHGSGSGNGRYSSSVPVDPIPQPGAVNTLAMNANSSGVVQFSSMFPFHRPGDATFEFYLQFQPRGHQSIFWTRIGNSDRNRFNLFVNGDSTFGFDYRSASGRLHKLVGQCCTGIAIAASKWTHLAIVRQGNQYDVYRDGLPAATGIDSNPDLPTSTGWEFSGRSGFMYTGAVDEIRWSDRALSPHEFLNAPGVPAPVPEPGLFGLLGFGLLSLGLGLRQQLPA